MSVTRRGRLFYILSIINCTRAARACIKSQVITYAITLKKRAQSINTGALHGVLRYHWLPTSDLTSVNTRSTWTLTVRNAWVRKRKECSQWKDFFFSFYWFARLITQFLPPPSTPRKKKPIWKQINK